MALSGTLDTFAIPDVLRLLSTTSKSGRLRITGDRGSGSVWMEDGDVVATELASTVSQNPTNAEVVFGLLRFSAGSFSFEADARAAHAGDPTPMEPILGEAENMLAEWAVIQGVIPSLDLWVGLTSELSGPDVMIDGSRWRGIAAIGSGSQVGAVAETLRFNEIETCRLVKELMELGLVEFTDEPAGVSPPASFEPEPEPFEPVEITRDVDVVDSGPVVDSEDEPDVEVGEPVVHGVDTDSVEVGEPVVHGVDTASVEVGEPVVHGVDTDSVQFDEPAGDVDGPLEEVDGPGQSDAGVVTSLASLGSAGQASIDPLLPAGDPLEDLAHPTRDDDLFAGGGTDVEDEELDPAEMARQLANLSPRAAKAVAAAAKATTQAERDAALAAVEAEDDTVNRGLLLKFLGSVDS